jgi:hypothetical protein
MTDRLLRAAPSTTHRRPDGRPRCPGPTSSELTACSWVTTRPDHDARTERVDGDAIDDDDDRVHGPGSRNKLTPSHARHYPGDAPLDVAGRALCAVHCLPRKELHEAYEMALRVSARSVHGGRVVDLCCGHGLLAQLLLVLDARFTHAVAVDRWLPKNHAIVHAALVGAFPSLAGRVAFVQAALHEADVGAADIVVSSHACGPLTDDVLARAVEAGACVAVLPCCHHTRPRDDLRGHDDPAAVIDDERVQRLRARGYVVDVDAIPADVSPKNRLLLARPLVA